MKAHKPYTQKRGGLQQELWSLDTSTEQDCNILMVTETTTAWTLYKWLNSNMRFGHGAREVPKNLYNKTAQTSWCSDGLQSSLSPGLRMSSILRIILTTWVASKICCFLPIRVSITCCCFMSEITQKHFIMSALPGLLPDLTVISDDGIAYHLCCYADSRCQGRDCSL